MPVPAITEADIVTLVAFPKKTREVCLLLRVDPDLPEDMMNRLFCPRSDLCAPTAKQHPGYAHHHKGDGRWLRCLNEISTDFAATVCGRVRVQVEEAACQRYRLRSAERHDRIRPAPIGAAAIESGGRSIQAYDHPTAGGQRRASGIVNVGGRHGACEIVEAVARAPSHIQSQNARGSVEDNACAQLSSGATAARRRRVLVVKSHPGTGSSYQIVWNGNRVHWHAC